MAIDVESYYERYAPMVFRRCRTLLRDTSRAEDAMQEVFLKLIDYRERLLDAYPSSLLYRMATNVCLNMIRSEKNKRENRDTDLLELIAAYEDPREKEGEVRDLLERIFHWEKESTRVMATLFWVDGMTLEEVARTMGMSVSGVRKRLREMKARVKETRLEVE